jgi:Integrase
MTNIAFIEQRVQPTSLARQLIKLVLDRNPRPLSRRRSRSNISFATQRQHVQKITAILCYIQSTETPLLQLNAFARPQLNSALEFIGTRTTHSGGFDNWIASLNRLLTWLNKKTLIQSAKELRKKIGIASRTGYAITNKATGNIEAINEAIIQLQHSDPNVAASLKICKVLPLRIREAICLNVAQAIEEIESTGTIQVSAGAKNGRSRTVEIWREDQLQTLKEVAYLGNSKFGSLVPEDQQLHVFMRHLYRSVRGVGILRLHGTNLHSLRHLLLQEYFKFITGIEAPILGQNLSIRQNNPEIKEAFQKVALSAGHSRMGKASAYLGSIRAYQKTQGNK